MVRDPWDVYFASLAGWLLHPGYQRPGTAIPTIEDVAELADQMMEERNGRMGRSRRSSG